MSLERKELAPYERDEATDYVVEIFAEMRRWNFQTHANAWVDVGGLIGRNQDAIKKTAAGLLKLLHLHHSSKTLTSDSIHHPDGAGCRD